MNIHFSKRASTALILYLEQFSGEDILCPVNVCYTVPMAVFLSGNRPVFYDVDPVTGMGTLETIQKRTSAGCKAMIYVFQYGNRIDAEEIRNFAAQRKMRLVLDYASCFITRENVPTARENEAGLLSFSFTKQLELGYGGALITKDGIRFDGKGKTLSLSDYEEANTLFEAYVGKNHVIDVDEVRRGRMADAFLGELSEGPRSKVADFFYSSEKLGKKVEKHKRTIDAIFSACIRRNEHVRFYPHDPDRPKWRFNLWSDRRDLILQKLMGSRRYPPKGIYASKWYPPIHDRFGDGGDYPGARKHAEGILNLFNDRNTSALAALKMSQIINGVSSKP